jgi:omega-6 fatty acid desaturase (delta-12 desaturase)
LTTHISSLSFELPPSVSILPRQLQHITLTQACCQLLPLQPYLQHISPNAKPVSSTAALNILQRQDSCLNFDHEHNVLFKLAIAPVPTHSTSDKMSTTAMPQRSAFKRTTTATTVDSTYSTKDNSGSSTPNESVNGSASSTSLSSLGSNDAEYVPKQKLVDTYGNEFELPDYTIKDIRDAIPKHCFERSAIRGLGYVARDIAMLAGTFVLFNKFCTPEYVPSYAARAALWAGYTFLQGLFGTGLWVMAHECGHQSFSPSKTLNDTVGWFCHSALLVPYFSWKISHGKHHKATGNMERDMVFLPRTREEHATRAGYLLHEMHELLEDAPLYTATHMIVQQLFGWPLYLIQNVTGHNNHSKQTEGKGVGRKNGNGSVNHFLPSSPLYERKDEHLILLSDLGLLITGTVLYLVGSTYGFQNLLVWYFVPYLWVNNWLGKHISHNQDLATKLTNLQ